MIGSIDYDSQDYSDSPIPGLFLYKDVVSINEEIDLLDTINRLQSNGSSIRNKIKTRVTMHFGYVFSAKSLKVDFEDSPPEIPEPIDQVVQKLFASLDSDSGLDEWKYDQMTINRYEVGGGIGAHTDTHSSFDPYIVSLSLESPTVMRFQNQDKTIDLWIPPRSLVVMSGESRYLYTHKIPTRKTDIDPFGTVTKRQNRTSITIRKVRKDMKCECKFATSCDYQTPGSFHTPDRL